MDNIQQIADAVEKGLQLILRASVKQGSTRLRRLRNELYSDSFHAVLALSCGLAKCQCCLTTVTVVVYCRNDQSRILVISNVAIQYGSGLLFQRISNKRDQFFCLLVLPVLWTYDCFDLLNFSNFQVFIVSFL